jgi:GAF domain-containing protein
MRSRALRLTLLVLLLLAAAAVGYFSWTAETRLRAQTAAARDFDTAIVAASRATLELRAAQQAYVAAGQGDEFWTGKVGAALPQLAAAIGSLRVTATSAQAQTALDSASGLLKDLEQTDLRARELVRGDRRLLASDLIFSDGLEMTRGIVDALDAARAAQQAEHGSSEASVRRSQLFALAGAGLLGVVVALLLVPGGARRDEDLSPLATYAPPPPLTPAPAAYNSPEDTLDFALALDDDSPRRAEPRPETKGADALNLSSVASLCTELARVVDTRSLPSILERTAAVLDAPGIILWIADPDGKLLTPIVAHGYPQQLLSRLGTIPRDAENATAAAFRTGLVQTVKSDAISNGAIAAPLLTAAGPVGVMAAEVRHERERQAAMLAAASIVAAQLATLVGPPAAARPQPSAGAAGA